jgi:thiamine pyrophosphokinase
MFDKQPKKTTAELLEEYAAGDTHTAAFIYVGGEISTKGIMRKPKENDIVIAADSGYLNAEKCGVTPTVVCGDFDSVSEKFIPKGIERVTVPAEKDFTDTMLAVDVALERGASEIVIIGGLSGRLDHTLSNMGILRMLDGKRIYASAEDGRNRIRYLKNSNTLIARSSYRYLSLIVDGDVAKGVSVEGCKYPLNNATLKSDNQYAVSNEIEKNLALVTVKKGALFIIESL